MFSVAVAQVSVWDGTHTTWTNGTGTETDPYLIENAQHLAHLAYYINNVGVSADTYWKLTTDIDLDSLQWTTIGNASYAFSGHFNGSGHTIANLAIYAETAGLFARMNGGSVKNTGIVGNSTITGRLYAGGIVGRATGTIIFENCSNTGNMAALFQYYGDYDNYSAFAGGIVGTITGTVTFTNCNNSGNISASLSGSASYMDTYAAFTGGIVGRANNSTITFENCYNTGNTTVYSSVYTAGNPNNSYVGGIVGSAIGGVATLKNCSNTGNITVSGGNYVSGSGIVGSVGIIGASIGGLVSFENCYNAGNISSTSTAIFNSTGGILGTAHIGTIIFNTCSNTGTISNSGPGDSGGISGFVRSGNYTINNCYNTGNLLASYSGGIVAYADETLYIGSLTINNCYNAGNLSGGGIVGSGASNVYNSYYLVGSASNPGGGTSQTELFMKTQEFVDLLNNGPEPNHAYTLDIDLVNDGYPVFDWQINATLLSLTISEGELTPEFSSTTYNYNVNVAYHIEEITIDAIANDPNAAVIGTGSKQLTVGTNFFVIIVTAEDGIRDRNYTVTVNRADSVGIIEIVLPKISVYPNPTTGELSVLSHRLSVDKIEIFDVCGRKQSSHHLIPSSSPHRINIAHLPAGIYLLKVGNEMVKVIKN